MDKALVKRMMELGIEADKILALVMDEPKQQEQELEQKQKQEQQEQKQEQKQEQPPKNQDAVLAAIEKLTGAIAAGNIRRDGFENKPETADDVLAKVLLKNPEEDKR